MKYMTFFILCLWMIPSSCQIKPTKTFDQLKLSPIGISDIPRDTIIITATKKNPISNNELWVFNMTTDAETFTQIILFNNNYRFRTSPDKIKLNEFGCFNISSYDNRKKIAGYYLSREDSKGYISSLINMLYKNNLDKHLAESIKERCLDPIDY